MKRKIGWIKCVMSAVMAIALCVTGIWPNGVVTTLAEENPFADVKETGWEYPFVKFAYDRGIMTGKDTTEEGKVIFEPSVSITRAEFVQVLYSKEGKPPVEYDDVFSDVPEGKWYTNAIIWAYSEGITAGNGTKFDVSTPISREQMATMLRKYAEYKEYDVTGQADLSGYADDNKISTWAVNNMKWAIYYAIMSGTSDNRIAPTENATRAQAATMLKKLIEAYESGSGNEEPKVEEPVTPSAEYGVREDGNGNLTLWVLAQNVDPAPTAFYILNNPDAPANQIPGYNMTKDATKGDNYYSVTLPVSYMTGDTCTYYFAYAPVGGTGRIDSPRTTVTLTGVASGGDEEREVPITALGLNKTTASVEVGNAVKLTAVYTPVNTTETGVTWTSSNENVATVDDGRVTGLAEGTVVITATSTINTALTATCIVTVVAEQKDTPPETKDDQMYFYFKNETNGEYTDDEIYWCILGKDPVTKELCYVGTEGQLIKATPALNTISKGDRKCADIFFTLEEQDFVYMPNIESGRMYFSYASPVYITINVAADGSIGYAGPDLNNTSDPNQDVLFEFIEFTINPPAAGSGYTVGEYWGNTTRVDFFSFPIVTTLTGEGGFVNTPGDADVFEKTVGDIGTREEIFEAFRKEVPEEFKTLVQDLRIMAPCKATFNTGKTYGNYFDDYIDEIYEEYKDKDLVFTCQAGTFRGRTTADGKRMLFNQDGGETGLVVNKPTTQDVLEGKDTLATGSSMEKVVQAQFCAAINRGVAHLTDSQWDNAALFYQNGTANYYADFFHRHSIGGYAYGFCYDDVYDHSTLLHYTKPTGLTIELKW